MCVVFFGGGGGEDEVGGLCTGVRIGRCGGLARWMVMAVGVGLGVGARGTDFSFCGHPLFAVTDRFCRFALFGARGREGERERLGWIGAGGGNVVVWFWRADELGVAG